MAADNKTLGQFDLMGIPPAPRGVPQVEVTFDIDANGIVHVSAKDKATNKEQSIRIQASGGLDEGEIDKMVKEAEANADADKARRDGVESRNRAEALIHTTEQSLGEHSDKLSDADKLAIDDAMTALRKTLANDDADVEAINTDANALAQASMKLGEAMYQSQQSSGDDDYESTSGGDEEDVVDADFEEVDGDDTAR